MSKESLHPFTYETSLTNCMYTVESPMEDLSPKRLDIKEVEPSDLRSYFDLIDIKKVANDTEEEEQEEREDKKTQ